MHDAVSARQLLESWAGDDEHRLAISRSIERIGEAVARISWLIQTHPGGRPAFRGSTPETKEEAAPPGLPLNDIFLETLEHAPVAALAFADRVDLVQLGRGESLAVAIDTMNGPDLDANGPVGTIFSIWPAAKDHNTSAWLQPGTAGPLAAGFAMYGPRTKLVLTVRRGVQVFMLDPRTLQFRLTRPMVRIPGSTCEYAVNAANHRHWDKAICEYVDDCLNGDRHPAAAFDMRWTASLVAEAFRVLVRGGICLYPSDTRPGYEQLPLRLVHEANPIALLMEQAGGAATDGLIRILEKPVTSLRERVPLFFGSADEVERVRRHHTELCLDYDTSPLFASRGLFQRQGRL